MWFLLPLAGAAASGIAGGMGAAAQRRQRASDFKANAAKALGSPWMTPNYQKVTPQSSVLGSALGGAVTGGLAGANVAEGFQSLTGGTNLTMANPTTPGAGRFGFQAAVPGGSGWWRK